MDPRRVLALALFGVLTFATGWDLCHKWRHPIALLLAPLFLMMFFCFVRSAFFWPAQQDQRIEIK
jgi:hypothetical protein